MFDRFSEKARRAIFFARYEAGRMGNSYIEGEHLLLGLLREDRVLISLLRIPSGEDLRAKIEGKLRCEESIAMSVDMPLSHECNRALG